MVPSGQVCGAIGFCRSPALQVSFRVASLGIGSKGLCRGMAVLTCSAFLCWLDVFRFEYRGGGRAPCSPLCCVPQVSQMFWGPLHLTPDFASRRGFLSCKSQFFFTHRSEAAFPVQLAHQNNPGPHGDRSSWDGGAEKAILRGLSPVAKAFVLSQCPGAPLCSSDLAFRCWAMSSSGQWAVNESNVCHFQAQAFKSGRMSSRKLRQYVMRYYYISIRMAKIWDTDSAKC